MKRRLSISTRIAAIFPILCALVVSCLSSGCALARAPKIDGSDRELIPCMGIAKRFLLGDEIRYGYCDGNHTMIIPARFTRTYPFLGKYAVVEKKGRFGVIDKNLHICLPFEYDTISLVATDSRKVVLAVTTQHTGTITKFHLIGGGNLGPSGFSSSEVGAFHTLVNLTKGKVITDDFQATSIYPFGENIFIDDSLYRFQADGSFIVAAEESDQEDVMKKFAETELNIQDPMLAMYYFGYEEQRLKVADLAGKIPKGYAIIDDNFYPYWWFGALIPSIIQRDWLYAVQITPQDPMHGDTAEGIYNLTKRRWEVEPFFIKTSADEIPESEPAFSRVFLVNLNATNDPDVWQCHLAKDSLGKTYLFNRRTSKIIRDKRIRDDIPITESLRSVESVCNLPYPGVFDVYTGFVEQR